MKGDDDLIDRITLCVGKTLAVLGFVGGWFRSREGSDPEVAGYHGIMMAIKIDKQIQT